MFGTYRIVHRPWRGRKPFYYLMIFELGGVIGLLILFAISQTDPYRKSMWQIGWDHRWNSNPSEILYAYANHKPIPTTPFVWSTLLTNFNIAISVLSLFILIAKLVATIMHFYYPILGIFIALSMATLYAASLGGQAGPDYTDSRYRSPTPWFLRKGCSYARPYGKYNDCLMAQGAVAVSAYMLVIYCIALGLAIWSMLPNKLADLDDDYDSDDGFPVTSKKQWEMQPRPMLSPALGNTATTTPFTPRTQAFHALDRKLPLRS
ncbi:hypothetical protein CMQ_3293 [Grosmannia clavigera kw1407]|uniref:Uncharacterized protein n=1 Tax=Grosmannia clavigera (strain kw1407 / UAMH 11150) TaxID=655863 RepID=F0XAK1_GROCL|nr:uncharacterized protein CMQ_3293 [Grosmannia clavigera kw1407]EFX05224.1 hypothetical protein CMQ_3293 [Grosmannia clavigera kw1407]